MLSAKLSPMKGEKLINCFSLGGRNMLNFNFNFQFQGEYWKTGATCSRCSDEITWKGGVVYWVCDSKQRRKTSSISTARYSLLSVSLLRYLLIGRAHYCFDTSGNLWTFKGRWKMCQKSNELEIEERLTESFILVNKTIFSDKLL